MSDSTEHTATCLCGAVRIHAAKPKRRVGACHCGMCRKWGGGPLIASDCGSEVTIEGEASVTEYDSSAWAARGFCSRCGTHLFYRVKGSGQYILPVGLFDEDPGFELVSQIFIDRKPEFYRFANETADLTEAEVFAKYGAPPG